MSKAPLYKKTIKNLLGQLKFDRNITQKKMIDAYVDYVIKSNKEVVKIKDLISTIRHDFSNYDELCKQLHGIERSRDVHRKFRNRVNGIIKEKFEHLFK